VLWLLLAAVSLGIFVYLFAIRSPENSLQAVALPLALLLILVAVFLLRLQPDFGPLLILAAAAFIPLSLPTGTASRLVDSLVLTMVFLGVWLAKMVILDQRLHIVRSPTNLPLIAFILVTLVAWIWSQVFRDPLVVIWDTFPLVQAASTVVMTMLPAACVPAGRQQHHR
jgi:cell division protein FtsW (lipid II flippase)